MFSVSFLIDIMIWLWLFTTVKNAGLQGNPAGLFSAILCAFLIIVWPWSAFKPKTGGRE